MQLAIDTNVLISAVLAKSKAFEIIVLGNLELFVPEYSLEEIEKHKKTHPISCNSGQSSEI